MHYVYVLRSELDGGFYAGCTGNLRRRMEEHRTGKAASTIKRLPLKLVYYEACQNAKDAFKREKYLRTTYGYRYLRNRLRHDFTG